MTRNCPCLVSVLYCLFQHPLPTILTNLFLDFKTLDLKNLWDLTFKVTKATSLVDHDFFFLISDSNYPLKRYLDRKIRTRVIETLLLWLAVKICPFQAYPKIVTESACSHSPQTWECFSTIINMQCNEKIMWKSSKSFAAKLFKIGSYKCLQYKFKVITRWLALAYMSLKSHPICF